MAKKKTVKKKTAKKKVPKKKALKRLKTIGRKVTIRQITDALYGIENWCRSLREVLLLLPADMKIKLPAGSDGGGVPQGLDYGCPPPRPVDEGGLDYGCPPPRPTD
jgi:hypothetical protein